MKFEDYRRHDMTALAQLVASREVSATELLDTALDTDLSPQRHPMKR